MQDSPRHRRPKRSGWGRYLRGRAAERLFAGAGEPAPGAGRLLDAAEALYGAWQRRRAGLFASGRRPIRRLPCPTVSIGNLTLGGTGKTPLAVDLGRRALSLGLRPVVISRGYKGGLERRGGVVCDGRGGRLAADMAGDEPFLIASLLEKVPVIVGRDRFRAGTLAWDRFRPDLVLLDDAFQHLKLARDLNLLLLDFQRPFGNGRLLPRGTLREPVEAMARADAVVVTRAPAGAAALHSAAAARLVKDLVRGPVFFSAHVPYSHAVPRGETPPRAEGEVPPGWVRRRALAFSGIARNADFGDTVRGLGLVAAGALAFPDHHAYAPQDVDEIVATARRRGADLLVTTEKDYARFAGRIAWPFDLVVVGVRISFGPDEAAFDAFLRRRLERIAGKSPAPPEGEARAGETA